MYILKIRYYRILHNLSQRQLAELIGVTQSYIARLESPQRVQSPTLHVLEKLSDLFDIELSDLVKKNIVICIVIISGIRYLKIISNA